VKKVARTAAARLNRLPEGIKDGAEFLGVGLEAISEPVGLAFPPPVVRLPATGVPLADQRNSVIMIRITKRNGNYVVAVPLGGVS
jgi:hypothetical protein